MSKFTSRGAYDCRAELGDKVDLVKIKQQFGAKAVQKNGLSGPLQSDARFFVPEGLNESSQVRSAWNRSGFGPERA
jgi:hypothetical protein